MKLDIEGLKSNNEDIRIKLVGGITELTNTILNNIEIYGIEENVLFHEFDISRPIHNNCSDGNLTETISGTCISQVDEKLVFNIDTYNSGYSLREDSISIENLFYVYEELLFAIENN